MLREAFSHSLKYRQKIVRVMFPEQPNPDETFPFQVSFEGRPFLFDKEWDNLSFCLREPGKVADKVADSFKSVNRMGRKGRENVTQC